MWPQACWAQSPSPRRLQAAAAVCGDQLVGNGGFESGTTPWTQTSGVISAATTAEPAHGGTMDAWLDGYGTTHTDTLSQALTLPAGCATASLTWWSHVDTKETSTTTAYDKLVVQAGTDTLASYSNLDKNTGYVQRTVDVSRYLGQTVTLKVTGTEDSSLATNFLLDDFALTTTGTSNPQSPVVTSPGSQTTAAYQAVSLQVQATDPQNDALTWTATGLPTGLAIGASTGKITGTPTTAGDVVGHRHGQGPGRQQRQRHVLVDDRLGPRRLDAHADQPGLHREPDVEHHAATPGTGTSPSASPTARRPRCPRSTCGSGTTTTAPARRRRSRSPTSPAARRLP